LYIILLIIRSKAAIFLVAFSLIFGKKIRLLLIIISALILILITYPEILKTFTGIFNFSQDGNKQRISSWVFFTESFDSKHIFISDKFGYYSNIANNYFGEHIILESSLFHFVMNIGLIGAIFMYLIIFSNVRENKQLYMPILFYSLMYQCLEVVSILTFLFYSKAINGNKKG